MFLYENEIVQNDLGEICTNINNIESLRNSSVLITGATGMLATYITSVLIYLNENKNFNIQIYALLRNAKKADDRFGNYIEKPYFHLVVQDVTEEIKINEKIDYIVHTAGAASPNFIVNDPVGIIKANTLGTINVMEFARKCNAKKVLYTSTREVYGKVDDEILEITEDIIGKLDQTEARSCYPESKRMGENICKSYSIQYGIPFNNVRIAHSYGPGMTINNDGRIMSDLIYYVVNNKNIELNSDGTAKRAFCYINDAVTAIYTVLLNGEKGESYNIANETEEIQIKDVALMLTNIFKEKNLRVTFLKEDKINRAGYSKIERVKLSTKKIENLGWKPQVKLEEGLKRTVNSFK